MVSIIGMLTYLSLLEDLEIRERILNFKHILLHFKQILDKALLEGVSSDKDLKDLQRELEQKNVSN